MSLPDQSTAAERFRLIGHTTVGAMGDGMQVAVKDGFAFFGHQGNGGTSIIDVRDPRHPAVVGNLPAPSNTHSHKVQIVGDLLLVNRERQPDNLGGTASTPWVAGISVFDISDPACPKPIGFWSCGGRGVHRMSYWTEPYAFVTAGSSDVISQFLTIVDFSDPARPQTIGQWWFPGMHHSERSIRYWDPSKTARLHHAIPGSGSLLYCGWWDLGIVVLDVKNPSAPELVSHLDLDKVDGPSRNTHTAAPIPGRDALVVTDECIVGNLCNIHDPSEITFVARTLDVSDPEKPRVLGRFPSVAEEFCHCIRGGKLGPHNIHEMRPGSYQSSNLVFMTQFNGGVRVYDIADLTRPREIGHFVPPAPPGRSSSQINDVFVDANGLVYATERYGGGLYILEFDDLAG